MAGGDLLQPQNLHQPAQQKPATQSQVPVGSTWFNSGGLNIDFDNLCGKNAKGNETAPTMNQLKIQSPVKSQTPVMGAINMPQLSPNIMGQTQNQFAQIQSGGSMQQFPNQFNSGNNIPLNTQSGNLFNMTGAPAQSNHNQLNNNQFDAFQ